MVTHNRRPAEAEGWWGLVRQVRQVGRGGRGGRGVVDGMGRGRLATEDGALSVE